MEAIEKTLENRYKNCLQVHLPSDPGASVECHPATRHLRESIDAVDSIHPDVFLDVKFCESTELSVEKMASQTYPEEKNEQRYQKYVTGIQ